MSPASVIAANRFGLGARPQELALIGDAHPWLARQVSGSRPAPAAISDLPASTEVFKVYAAGLQQRRAKKGKESTAPAAQQLAAKLRAELVPIYLQQVAARYRVAATSEESFRERLVHFWTNHFAVSADKPQVLALAGTLENEAIRPHVHGRFLDMLLAVETHPAMILYLDNQRSVGPDSELARRAAGRAGARGRKLDINENLAREILELHTLGVNGGYTQLDVTTFAQVLTGWSLGGERQLGGMLAGGTPGKFAFHEAMHEPGAKMILGKRYAQDGAAQPRAVLEDLARHPATAQHVATKLVRHFVADDPPAAAVQRVAKAFTDSNGDLPTLHRALIDLNVDKGAKFKTPHELIVSAMRVLDFVPAEPRQIVATFQELGQRPYTPGSPAGWADTADRWDGPDALLKRIEWASALASRMASRVDPLQIAEHGLGAALSEHTRVAIKRASSAAQGLTLLFASPEFQRR